jgi:Rab-GTPase-TBC domain
MFASSHLPPYPVLPSCSRQLERIAELVLQKAYTFLVRLHDSYAMHEIFRLGFPGLLEALYVQERILERMMPSLYDLFVSSSFLLLFPQYFIRI